MCILLFLCPLLCKDCYRWKNDYPLAGIILRGKTGIGWADNIAIHVAGGSSFNLWDYNIISYSLLHKFTNTEWAMHFHLHANKISWFNITLYHYWFLGKFATLKWSLVARAEQSLGMRLWLLLLHKNANGVKTEQKINAKQNCLKTTSHIHIIILLLYLAQ